MTSTRKHSRADGSVDAEQYPVRLERATRGLLALNVSVLEHVENSVGLEPLRALQSLDRRGPSKVGELGDDLGLVPSTASRLSDRLAEAGLITRRPAPNNRRSTLLELTDAGRAILDELVALRIRAFGEVADQYEQPRPRSTHSRRPRIHRRATTIVRQEQQAARRVPPSRRQVMNARPTVDDHIHSVSAVVALGGAKSIVIFPAPGRRRSGEAWPVRLHR